MISCQKINTEMADGHTSPLHKVLSQPDVLLNVITQVITPQNINVKDRWGSTALQVVAREKRWDLVPVFVQHGADINVCGTGHRTPLHEALSHRGVPIDIAIELISSQNINMQDRYGCTALHQIISEKRWDIVPVLVQKGADVNRFNKWSETPLHAALSHPNVPLDVITQLISPENVNMLDSHDCTALHLVASNKRWDLVSVHVQNGADVNVCDNWKRTPLHAAVKHTSVPLDVVTQLISPQNINMKNNDGCTALHLVAISDGGDLNLCGTTKNTLILHEINQICY